ncbi:MAG: response regulator transcription factor [Burkholderiales bacterium]
MSTIFIMDDHDIVRFGLSGLLNAWPDLKLVGEAANVHDGLLGIAQHRPDLVISDLSMGDSQGLDTVRSVVAAQCGRSVLVISMHDELIYAEQVVALGARGYLMKEHALQFALAAVLAVLGGQVWVSAAVSAQMLNRLQPQISAHPGAHSGTAATASTEKLSTRELDVLEKLSLGKTTKETAFELGISSRTVDIYRASLKRKLGLKSGAELISWAASKR